MNVKDFYYELPEELIAQTPLPDRSSSRLLRLDKKTGKIEHGHFTDITRYIRPGDCLVLNDTRVLPARLFGVKESTGGPIEFVLLKRISEADVLQIAGAVPEKAAAWTGKDSCAWEVLLRPENGQSPAPCLYLEMVC